MTSRLRRSTLTFLLAVIVMDSLPAIAAVPLLDEVEAVYMKDGTFMRDLNLKEIQQIRLQDESGRAIDGWRLGSLIFGLKTESEKEVVANPGLALRKVELALRAVERWRPALEGRNLTDEGNLFMTRWFLLGDPQDLASARERFEQKDVDPLNGSFKGSGGYFLGASYELLADWAREIERSRDEQIGLLRAGIEANKTGRAKYPSFDSTTGLSALYRKLDHVSGKSALPQYVDEWVQYMQTQPEKAQMSAAPYLADALFQQERDAEGVTWIERYARYWAQAEVKPELRERLRESRCLSMSPSINRGFALYQQRKPASFSALRDRVCGAVT